MDHKKLLNRLQICDFILVEVGLFLDTHPNDKAALEYFSKYAKIRKEAAAEYTANYGPITMLDCDQTDSWCWVQQPWPWEKEMED